MANFAVAAPDDVIEKGNRLLEQLALPREKKGETLNRAFDILAKQLDGEVMRNGGVDVEAMDAALANIRAQFFAAVTGKDEIVAKKNAEILELRNERHQTEAELRKKAENALEERKQFEETAAKALEQTEQLKKDLERANELVKYIDTLKAQVKEAEEKSAQFPALQEEKKQLEAALDESRRKIEALERDTQTQLRELRAQSDRMVSDARKDAALAQEKALAARERELSSAVTEKIRQIDRENVRLQMENETLKAEIERLNDTIAQMQTEEANETVPIAGNTNSITVTGDVVKNHTVLNSTENESQEEDT